MAVLPEQQDESLFSPADPPHPAVSPSTIRIKRKKEKKRPLFMLLCIET